MTNLNNDKMTDREINELLEDYGLEIEMPGLFDGKKGAHPRLDSGIYTAKDEIKGAHYDSTLNKVTDRINQYMEAVKRPIKEASEWENNIKDECLGLINYCLEEGYIVEDQLKQTHGFTQAREERNKPEGDPTFQDSAAALVGDYKESMHDLSKVITFWKEEAMIRLSEAKFNFDYSQKSEKWIIKKAQKERLFSRGENDDIAKAYAEKDNMIAQFTAMADTYTIGESEYKNALMFAHLYLDNLREQRERELEYNRKHGAQAAPYKYVGFDSITSLFPLGAKEVLAWSRNHEFKVFKKDGVRTAAYFELNREIGPDEAAALKGLTDKLVLFQDGFLEGTKYQVSTEETMRDGKAVVPNRQRMEKEGLAPDYIEELLASKFKRGAKAWFGDRQQGKVLYVEVFKKSFKLWMADFHNVK